MDGRHDVRSTVAHLRESDRRSRPDQLGAVHVVMQDVGPDVDEMRGERADRDRIVGLVDDEDIEPGLLVRRLRAEPLLMGVPVIFQTAHYLESEIHKLAVASGIEHILSKPAEPQEILRAVQESLQKPAARARLPQTGQLHREHLQLLADKLYQKNVELEQANERLRSLSLTDELTGLNNRRGFAILANGLFKFARRANHPLCLL